jgi:hypothetical protein
MDMFTFARRVLVKLATLAFAEVRVTEIGFPVWLIVAFPKVSTRDASAYPQSQESADSEAGPAESTS